MEIKLGGKKYLLKEIRNFKSFRYAVLIIENEIFYSLEALKQLEGI